MRELGQSVLSFFSSILGFIHDAVEPLFGIHSWGWAIIGLTLFVRILLLPLAIKQTRSMKGVQQLQPEIKAIQERYKTDREMMRKDPEKYRARKQKQQQEMMALYQREGVNPAASCLPLLAQAPVFVALFWTLRDETELLGAPFYFITAATEGGLDKLVSAAGWPGWLLILLMSGTMFFSQKQMMSRNKAMMVDNPMAQQQKILLYVMPVFLAAISFQFPLGILLYWVTTNLWQIVQQAIILREGTKLDVIAAEAGKARSSGQGDAPSGPARGATSGRPRGGATSGRPAPASPGDDEPGPDEPERSEAEATDVDDVTGADEDLKPPAENYSNKNGGGRSGRHRLPRRGGS
jgi:YidC/Oxa1 family membrane protein insertase